MPGLKCNLCARLHKGVRFTVPLLSFEFGFQGFYFLLLLKFLLAERLAGLEFVVFQPDGEEFSAFPAAVRPLIT